MLQAVAQLGYTTNSAGKQLRTQRSGKLLVIVPDILNPFFLVFGDGTRDWPSIFGSRKAP